MSDMWDWDCKTFTHPVWNLLSNKWDWDCKRLPTQVWGLMSDMWDWDCKCLPIQFEVWWVTCGIGTVPVYQPSLRLVSDKWDWDCKRLQILIKVWWVTCIVTCKIGTLSVYQSSLKSGNKWDWNCKQKLSLHASTQMRRIVPAVIDETVGFCGHLLIEDVTWICILCFVDSFEDGLRS